MQTYTFTESELRQLLKATIQLFSQQLSVYDFSGDVAAPAAIDEIIGAIVLINDTIPFDGLPLAADDTGNAEFDAAIELPL